MRAFTFDTGALIALERNRHRMVTIYKTARVDRITEASCIDAIVMATAARHGGVVFTSDVKDLIRLQAVFRSVRVLAV